MTFTAPNKSSDVIPNEITAGEYYGIAIDTGCISHEQMEALKAKLEATKAKLEAEDFANLTKDDILGDLLYTTALSYFAELDTMNYVQSKTMGVVNIRLPSESIFSLELSVNKLFGVPKSVEAGGLAMDVARDLSIVKALDGDNNKKIEFMLASGQNSSALEHSVPEQMFSTPENPAYGISAVKALKVANDQGIPIYTINQSNIATILPQLQVDLGTIADIQNAVNAGMVATVSKTDITYNGWTGVGYIITDPNTGAGAYMISGGINGGWLLVVWVVIVVITIIAIAALCILSGVCAAIGAAIISTMTTIINAVIAAIEAIKTSMILVYNAAKLWTYYLIPFLLPAVPYCLDLPPNVPWVVVGICTVILAIVFIKTARR